MAAESQNIEDVLSSIRRLVSEEVAEQAGQAASAATARAMPGSALPADALVLQPGARVTDPDDPYQAIPSLAQEERDARDAAAILPEMADEPALADDIPLPPGDDLMANWDVPAEPVADGYAEDADFDTEIPQIDDGGLAQAIRAEDGAGDTVDGAADEPMSDAELAATMQADEAAMAAALQAEAAARAAKADTPRDTTVPNAPLPEPLGFGDRFSDEDTLDAEDAMVLDFIESLPDEPEAPPAPPPMGDRSEPDGAETDQDIADVLAMDGGNGASDDGPEEEASAHSATLQMPPVLTLAGRATAEPDSDDPAEALAPFAETLADISVQPAQDEWADHDPMAEAPDTEAPEETDDGEDILATTQAAPPPVYADGPDSDAPDTPHVEGADSPTFEHRSWNSITRVPSGDDGQEETPNAPTDPTLIAATFGQPMDNPAVDPVDTGWTPSDNGPFEAAASGEVLSDDAPDPVIASEEEDDDILGGGIGPGSALPDHDVEALRELVAEVVRQELAGALGERITRNVRKLVRRELKMMFAGDDLD